MSEKRQQNADTAVILQGFAPALRVRERWVAEDFSDLRFNQRRAILFCVTSLGGVHFNHLLRRMFLQTGGGHDARNSARARIILAQ